MSRVKGSPKTGGRQKGTPNKVTRLNQQALVKLIEDYHASGLFKSDFKELQPRERIDTIIKLLAFVLPKPQAVAVDLSTKPTTIEETLAELAEEI